MTDPEQPTSANQPDVDGAAAGAKSPDPELTPDECHAAADRLVRQYTLGAMAVGLVPLPLVDLAALVGLQLKMLHSLSGLYQVDFKADLGRSAVASLVGGALPGFTAPTLAASLGKLIPVSGQLLGGGAMVVLNGGVTYALGKVFTQHFAAGGTFLTFDPEAVRDFFEQQLEAGKKVAEELKSKTRRKASKAGDGTAASSAGPTVGE